MGSGRVLGGYRYSHPPGPPRPHHPGYTLPHYPYMPYVARAVSQRVNIVVGLISVDQLTLVDHIPRFGTMTEVYNVAVAGRNNNHFTIPGTK